MKFRTSKSTFMVESHHEVVTVCCGDTKAARNAVSSPWHNARGAVRTAALSKRLLNNHDCLRAIEDYYGNECLEWRSRNNDIISQVVYW